MSEQVDTVAQDATEDSTQAVDNRGNSESERPDVHQIEVEATSRPVMVHSSPAGEAPVDERTAVQESAAAEVPVTAADETAEPTSSAAEESQNAGNENEADGSKRVVRMLSIGQQITGTVKRVTDFGAFVDIGVGRDGLIHISELSVRRVGKVTDVLQEGQEVTAWIKKLDRDRNRISLTLIDPNQKTIRDLEKGDIVQGTVSRIMPYGAFIDIGIGRDALLHVREMGEKYVAKPEDVVSVGDVVEARIIDLSRRRGRVDLSLKGLRPEPEPEPAPEPEQASQMSRQSEPEPEEEDVDDFEDVEVLSPMELAFKKAMEAGGYDLNVSRKKQGKRSRREKTRSIQDEIIARTLSSGRK